MNIHEEHTARHEHIIAMARRMSGEYERIETPHDKRTKEAKWLEAAWQSAMNSRNGRQQAHNAIWDSLDAAAARYHHPR